jgi:hypothetical protein
MRTKLWAVALASGLVALAGGCGGDDDRSASVTTEVLPPPNSAEVTTTTALDPERVTVEYVQAQIDALDASYGAMIHRHRDDGGPVPETEAWPSLLFIEPALSVFEASTETLVASDFLAVRDEPQGPETSVQRLVTVTPYCLYFEATRSYELLLGPVLDVVPTYYVALAWEDGARSDPAGMELPPWKLGFEGRLENGEEPGDPCS